jgi:hypothetical protein
MTLVNMKQNAEEAQEATLAADAPEYPYGLELRLDEEALAKLGLTQPPAVGTTMQITAQVTVTSASQYQTQDGGAEASSCWQITDMAIEPSASTNATKAGLLYPD